MIKARGCLLIMLRLSVTINLVLPTVLAQVTYPWSDVRSTKISVCKETDCHDRAKTLLHSIDKDVDPCSDFYEYVCGTWQKKNSIPVHYYEWSVDTKLDAKAIREMMALLKRDVSLHDTEDVRKAKSLYNICNSMPSTPITNGPSLKLIVNEAGPWPMFQPKHKDKVSWLDIHNYYLSITGDAGLFGISIQYDEQDNSMFLKMSSAAHPCGLIQRFGEWNKEETSNHQQFLLMLARIVMNESNEPEAKDLLQDIADVISFRRNLQKSNPNTIDYSSMSIKYFSTWYDVKANVYTGGIKIPWLEIFRNVFKNTGVEINEETQIKIRYREIFAALPYLLSKTPKHVIVNHLHLYFIEKHILLDDKLHNALSKVLISNGKLIGNVMPRQDRSVTCVLSHPLKETLGNMYVNTFFKKGARESALYYANKMKDMIKLDVSNSKWLQENTKRILLSKLTNIDLYMGYRDSRKAEHTYQKDIKMIPYRAISFYTPAENSLFISAGYFKSPMYGHKLPSAVNYGTISAFIAYGLYHALSAQRINVKPMSIKRVCRYCWSKEMMKQYELKSKCFEDMYNNITDKDLEKVKPTPKSNGAQTLLENIADVMGLRTAMDAYKKLLWESQGKCRILPHMKDLTCLKLFFISHAATYCTVSPTWTLLKHMQHGTHSTPRLRVNVPLSSMVEFRKAFNCPANSPMVSEKSCRLW